MTNNISAEIIKAVILGHAVGDALGVPVEFEPRKKLDNCPVTDMRGFGTYPFPAGAWSDDTSMTLCALESLAKGRADPDEIMVNFGRWYYNDEFTPSGKMFDIGTTCSCAIDNYFICKNDAKHCGLTTDMSNGNGSLMRINPFVLFSLAFNGTDLDKLWRTVELGSSLTHAHPRTITACQIYSTVLAFLLDHPSKAAVDEGICVYRTHSEKNPELHYFGRIDYETLKSLTRSEIKSSGYVVDTLEAALWCLLTTDSYKECVVAAVNLGEDTGTIAAISGGLAGAMYGLDAIPKEWLDTLQRREYIEMLCEKASDAWVNAR